MNTFWITMAILNVQCCLPVAPLSKPFYMLVIVKILREISENSEINCFKYLFSLRRFLFPKFLDQCSQGKQCALHPACMPFKVCLEATDFSSCSHLPFWNLKQNWSRENWHLSWAHSRPAKLINRWGLARPRLIWLALYKTQMSPFIPAGVIYC